MSFILHTDKKRTEYIEKQKENIYTHFHYYCNIIIDDNRINNEFLTLKKSPYYTNILIRCKDEHVLVQLDDYDIINIFSELKDINEEIFRKLLKFLYQLFNGIGEEFMFVVKDKEFIEVALPLIDEDILINTKADFKININELITLLNLIILKEAVAITNNPLIIKENLAKYICLAEFYILKDSESKKILEASNFDTSKSLSDSKNKIALAGKKKLVINLKEFTKIKKV